MEEILRRFADWVALGVETAAALLIAIGAVEALVAVLPPRGATIGRKRLVWLHFARWLVLALEFELAADVIRTSITPNWDDIGQLAAIALIRTFLGYFLERDIRELGELPGRAEGTGRAVPP